MKEDKLLEALRSVGSLEYIIITHVENLAVRDRLKAELRKLESILRGYEEDTEEVRGDMEDQRRRDWEDLHGMEELDD